MKWADLTTAEIDQVDRDTVVILPIAAVEQHGPHLPLSTDCRIGMHLLESVEQRCSNDMLILPQVQVCCSDHHMDFVGTLTVRHETFLAYAGDILRSVIAHGFRTLLIFNSHGGNQAIGRVLVDQIGHQEQGCRIALATWWTLAAPALAQIRESELGGANHACEFETSLMMEADPASVRRHRIEERSLGPTTRWTVEDMLAAPPISLYRSMKDKSGGTGTVGEPALATRQKGRAITEAVTIQLQQLVQDLRRIHEVEK